MKNAITVKTSLLILAIVTTFAVTFFFKLSIERAEKKAREIERIESHSFQYQNCVQYALVAAEKGCFHASIVALLTVFICTKERFGNMEKLASVKSKDTRMVCHITNLNILFNLEATKRNV